MRTALALLALLPLTLPAEPARADEPKPIKLGVGQRVTVGGNQGRCDDLKVATITLDNQAIITGLGQGVTLCSSFQIYGRQVYRVEVVPAGQGTPGEKKGE